MNGIGYVRVSTDNQLENYSIEEQTERLKAFCIAKDVTLVKIYTDGGYSGGNTNRPALQQMLADIERGGIDSVIVYKLDRLSRSQKDTLMLIEDYFLFNKVDFISICENFDTSTPFGRAMIGILSVFAQLEKDQITERFTMGRIGRAKNGYYHGGSTAPTGYDYIDGNLVVNEYEAMQVDLLFERFAKGYTLNNCWNYMKEHYTTKYGAWTSDSLVKNVLQNSVYIGKVKFRGQEYNGNHKPIVTNELFSKVQDMFENSRRNAPEFRRSPFRASTLLTSLIYCGKCGARFHGEHGNYSCYSRTKGDKKYIVDPNCKNKKWKIEELDAIIIDYITKFDFGETKKITKQNMVKDYSKRLKEIDSQIAKLIDLYQIQNIPIETITTKIKSLTDEKEHLSVLPKVELPKTNEEMVEYRNRFITLLDKGDLLEKRACLTQIIDKIIIDDDNVKILLK